MNNLKIKILKSREVDKKADNKIMGQKPYLLFMFNPFGINKIQCFRYNNIEVIKSNKAAVLFANDLYINELKRCENIDRNNDFNLPVIYF